MKGLRFGFQMMILAPAFCMAQNVGIGTSTPLYKLHVTGASTTNSNSVIYSLNSGTTGNAILAVSNNAGTTALNGTSNYGVGVMAYSNNNMAVSASAISGTALYANSISGYSIVSYGKVKIYGGNTNPRDGATLTTDASGNAVWKTPKVAFSAMGIAGNRVITKQSTFRIQFVTEEYDYNNNFLKAGDDPSANNTSQFTAPVSGLYEFKLNVELENYSGGSRNDDTRYGDIAIWRNRNGVITELASAGENWGGSGDMPWINNNWSIQKDVKLLAGDKIYATVWMRNDDSDETLYFGTNAIENWFSGRLLWED